MKITGKKIILINVLLSLILYPSILLPLTLYGIISMVIQPIIVLIQNMILWGSIVYLEYKKGF